MALYQLYRYHQHLTRMVCLHLKLTQMVVLQWKVDNSSQDKLLFDPSLNCTVIETSLNRISLGPAFVFGIDRCLVYTDYINKEFLNFDFIFNRIMFYWGFGSDRFPCSIFSSVSICCLLAYGQKLYLDVTRDWPTYV